MRTPNETRPHPRGGEQRRYRFANDYGASVICSPMSYGGVEGFWELAVIKWSGESFTLCYDTPITDDVIGWLTEEKVDELLTQIEEL